MDLEFSLQSISFFLNKVIRRKETIPKKQLLTESYSIIDYAKQNAIENMNKWAFHYQNIGYSENDIKQYVMSKEKKLKEIRAALDDLVALALKGAIEEPLFYSVRQSDRRDTTRFYGKKSIFFKQRHAWDEALLHNISETGAMISTLKHLDENDPIILNLINNHQMKNEQIVANVVWQSVDNKIGLHFSSLLPARPAVYL